MTEAKPLPRQQRMSRRQKKQAAKEYYQNLDQGFSMDRPWCFCKGGIMEDGSFVIAKQCTRCKLDGDISADLQLLESNQMAMGADFTQFKNNFEDLKALVEKQLKELEELRAALLPTKLINTREPTVAPDVFLPPSIQNMSIQEEYKELEEKPFMEIKVINTTEDLKELQAEEESEHTLTLDGLCIHGKDWGAICDACAQEVSGDETF